jgi:hypothetical protein
MAETESKEKIYLEYLDKEMSIMGILSTFCVAALALVLDRVLTADKGHLVEIWSKGCFYILLGSGLMLFAAFFFYSQRSLLAWYYGQISLSLAREPTNVDFWLQEADSWAAWIRYRIAFGCVAVAFIEYGMALLCVVDGRFKESRYSYALLPLLIAVVVLTPWLLVLVNYKYEDNYLKKFFSDAKRWINKKR